MDIPAGAHIHAERLYQSEIEVFRQRDGAVDRFGYRVVDPRLVAGSDREAIGIYRQGRRTIDGKQEALSRDSPMSTTSYTGTDARALI